MLVGAALLFLAVPQTIEAFYVLKVDGRQILLKSQPNIECNNLAELEASIDRALEWRDSGELFKILGHSLSRCARTLGPMSTKEKKALYEAVEDSFRDALRRNPGDPSIWMWLVYTRLVGGDRESAAKALTMSLLLGPDEPSLIWYRLNISLNLWGDLDIESRKLVRRQIFLAARADLNRLVVLAKKVRRNNSIILRALLVDKELYRAFLSRKRAPGG